jgi:pathogenesis-related protein 1
MLAALRAKLRLAHATRWGVCLSLIVCSSACSGDDDGKGPNNTGKAGSDAQVYVNAHNAVRAAVHKPTNYTGTWAALPPVTWSDEVATSAQEWANHLQGSMSCGLMHADGTGYGENLAAGSNVDAARAVELWASELDNYTYSPKYEFETNTGHYTQVVWRKTTEIGCASAKCSASSVVVCRYEPPGNYVGQAPY